MTGRHVDETPGDVPIRWRSTQNVTDDRLRRRLAYLCYTFKHVRDFYASKGDLWPRAGEAATLHREGLRRGLDMTEFEAASRYTVEPWRKGLSRREQKEAAAARLTDTGSP